MSLGRLIFYSSVLGGWAALAGWLLSEPVFRQLGGTFWQDVLQVSLVSCIVGAAIGVGLSIAAGLANGHWKQLALRARPGFLFGALGGAIGGFVGSMLFGLFLQLELTVAGLPKAVGWMVLGAAIGLADGLSDRSWPKIRNGLIGGSLGGLLGGFLFGPIALLAESETGMASRAIGFTVLGASIGCLIGTVQVAFKQAWLTVLDGYRTGRQLILSRSETVLGRAEYCPLPFIGPTNQELELHHLAIVQRSDNRFVLRDNGSQLGTLLNGRRIDSEELLHDGDVIRLGTNYVRFNEKQGQAEPTAGGTASPLGSTPGHAPSSPPKPPPPPTPKTTTTPQPLERGTSQSATQDGPTRLAPPPPPPKPVSGTGPSTSEIRSPAPPPQLPKPPPPPPKK
jgi:hypothetical protein